jgi:hypothetical protein
MVRWYTEVTSDISLSIPVPLRPRVDTWPFLNLRSSVCSSCRLYMLAWTKVRVGVVMSLLLFVNKRSQKEFSVNVYGIHKEPCFTILVLSVPHTS